MRLYPVYSGIRCPACGSTEHNRDLGPYEVAFPAATEDHGCPQVHYMSCRNCGKGFDAGPPRVASRWQAMFDGYPA
jgi:hypothetical protein